MDVIINGIVLVTGVLVALLGLLVLLNNPKAVPNRLFFGFALATMAWIGANLAASLSADPGVALLWSRLAVIGGAMVPYAMLLFALDFPRRTPVRRYLKAAAVLPPFLFVVTALTPLNVVSSDAYAAHIEPGILYTPLGVYVLTYTIASLVVLGRGLGRAQGKAREQFRYVMAGILIMAVPGTALSVVLPNVGLPELAQLSPATALGFVIAVSYAMLRHQLLNIRLVVARSVAYVLLLLTLAGGYGAAAFGAGAVLFPGEGTSAAQQVLNITLAIILAFTFQPLRRFFERLTDRVFYRERYDTQDVLDEVGKTIATELELDRVLRSTLETLCQRLKIASGRFVILDGRKTYATVSVGTGIVQPRSLELAKLNQPILSADDLTGGIRKRIMERCGVRVSVSLRTRKRIVGYLLLGDKRSGDIYSEQDLRLLRIFRQEAAVAIENAKAYEKIARFNATLRQKVNDATRRLRVANDNLRELDKTKDEFISLASHQLRTPLTAVKGYLSMLEEGDAGRVNRAQREYLETARHSSEQMVRLISDLLNVSRLAGGRFVVDRQPTDLAALLREEVAQVRPNAQAKGIRLVSHVPRRLPKVSADPDKIRQVMMNFLDNAIYYTDEGSVTVSLRRRGKMLEFTVTDTGIGVPVAAQKKLFKKFFRAENAKQSRPDGTGLGLYLAKRVVEVQGGEIVFESVPGQGSTFGFRLPLKG